MSLADELGKDYAPAWRPDPGDILVGEIVDLSERDGFDGDPYPIITVRRADGVELAFHAFHAVAKNELARLQPEVGAEIGIRYKGLVTSGNGRGSYHAYRIKLAGATRKGVNWNRYREDDPVSTSDAGLPAAFSEMPASKPPASMQAKAADTFGDDVPWDD